MAKKGSEKNTKDKTSYNKLMAQKRSKKKSVISNRKTKLRAIFNKSQENKEEES